MNRGDWVANAGVVLIVPTMRIVWGGLVWGRMGWCVCSKLYFCDGKCYNLRGPGMPLWDCIGRNRRILKFQVSNGLENLQRRMEALEEMEGEQDSLQDGFVESRRLRLGGRRCKNDDDCDGHEFCWTRIEYKYCV